MSCHPSGIHIEALDQQHLTIVGQLRVSHRRPVEPGQNPQGMVLIEGQVRKVARAFVSRAIQLDIPYNCSGCMRILKTRRRFVLGPVH
jgi:hypothetical protein